MSRYHLVARIFAQFARNGSTKRTTNTTRFFRSSLESSKPHTDSRHHVRKIFREDGLGNIIIEHTARVQQTIFPVLRVVVVVVKVVLSRKRIREKFPSEPPSAKSSSTTKTTKTNTPNALRFFEETTEKTARKHLHHAGYRNHAVPNEGRFTRQRAGI